MFKIIIIFHNILLYNKFSNMIIQFFLKDINNFIQLGHIQLLENN